jgi:chromate transport protein ChrA
MQYAWYDFVGTVGTAVIIVTYILLQTERIKSSSLVYSLLNAVGAAMIIVSLLFSFNFPAFMVEFFWLLISLFGIVKFFLQKSNAQKN